MDLQQLKNNPALQDKLASEYVLGTLRGGARRRFEKWLMQDAALRQITEKWEAHLVPMAEFSVPVPAPKTVWPALEKRLHLKTTEDRWTYWRNLREDLAFWRGLGMFSTTAAILLASILLSKPVEQITPQNNYVATLSDEKAQAIAIITGDSKRAQLQVRILTAQNIAADKSLELWAVGKDGKVKSLGLVASKGTVNLPMPANMTAGTVPLLAVTLEPKGGSGNPEKPSGPIIFKGNWIQI